MAMAADGGPGGGFGGPADQAAAAAFQLAGRPNAWPSTMDAAIRDSYMASLVQRRSALDARTFSVTGAAIQ
jgi:hypothetical protein